MKIQGVLSHSGTRVLTVKEHPVLNVTNLQPLPGALTPTAGRRLPCADEIRRGQWGYTRVHRKVGVGDCGARPGRPSTTAGEHGVRRGRSLGRDRVHSSQLLELLHANAAGGRPGRERAAESDDPVGRRRVCCVCARSPAAGPPPPPPPAHAARPRFRPVTPLLGENAGPAQAFREACLQSTSPRKVPRGGAWACRTLMPPLRLPAPAAVPNALAVSSVPRLFSPLALTPPLPAAPVPPGVCSSGLAFLVQETRFRVTAASCSSACGCGTS